MLQIANVANIEKHGKKLRLHFCACLQFCMHEGINGRANNLQNA